MALTTTFETVNGFVREDISLGNWRTRPFSFWSFRHVAEMVRSARIKTHDATALPGQVDNPDLLSSPAASSDGHSIAELLRQSEVDSFILSRKGETLCEWHAPGRGSQRSPSGLLDIQIDHRAGRRHPAGSGCSLILRPWSGRWFPRRPTAPMPTPRCRTCSDMRVSLDFDESYLSQEAYARYRRAMSWNPPSSEGNDEGNAVLPQRPAEGLAPAWRRA